MDNSFISKLNAEIAEKFDLLQPITELKEDGSINRFDSVKQSDNAIWVCVHPFNYKGNLFRRAIFGNWRHGLQYTYSDYDKTMSQSKEFRKLESDTIKKTKEKLEKEKQEKYESCRQKWYPLFDSWPTDSPTHEYLVKKKIRSNFHARVTPQNVLFVPAWRSDGVFSGGQRIFLDPETGKFEKRYTYGIEKLGSFCPFGKVRDSKFIYIAEGFATAASIASAFQGDSDVAVACVWDTSNLLEGAKAIRSINKNCCLIFAADRDVNSDPKWNNIGERKAKHAANALSNSIVRTVSFSEPNPTWSDYNDLHQFEGIAEVYRQLEVSESDFEEVIPLGFRDKTNYYFLTHRKSIREFKLSEHTNVNLISSASRKYWGDRYGWIKNKDGKKVGPDWNTVIEKLNTECAEVGFFNNSKVRALGAWSHNDNEVIVNLGDRLFYDGDYYPLFNNNIDNNHFYEATNSHYIDFSKPMDDEDSKKVVDAFKLLKYKSPTDFIIVVGWIYAAQVFAALPWRPHIWFTGPRGIGKSTILNFIHELIDFSIMVQGTTAAGIRQEILNSATAVLYDEGEPETEKDREKMTQVLHLARECSTRGKYKIIKGSASGKAISYNTNAAFCAGSIQVNEMGGADTSRFFVIEMKSVQNDAPEEFVRIQNAMAEVTPHSGALFARVVNNFKYYLSNIEFCKKVIKGQRIEARQADQLAPIICGYYGMLWNGPISESFILNTIDQLDFKNSDYAKANQETDSEKCFQDILELVIPGPNKNVGQLVDEIKSAISENKNQFIIGDNQKALGLVGVRYFENEGTLFIAGSSSSLKNKMERFSRFTDYKNVLKRHPDFKGMKKVRVSGKSMNGLVLSF